MLQRLCIFCGSNSGHRAIYRDAASALGRLVAERGIELVYGGGHVLKAIHSDMVVVESDSAALLASLEKAPVVAVSKWIMPGVEKAMP